MMMRTSLGGKATTFLSKTTQASRQPEPPSQTRPFCLGREWRGDERQAIGDGFFDGCCRRGSTRPTSSRRPHRHSTPRLLPTPSPMAAPSNAFANELEKWIYQKYIRSVVFVEFRKKDYNKLKTLWDKVAPIRRGPERNKALQAREAGLQCQALCSTGFVVKVEESLVSILACAHVLECSFSRSMPITPEQVEQYFEVHVLCDHHETLHFCGLEDERQYVQASVQSISCGMDLMLLSIPRPDFHAYCHEIHVPIPMAPTYPEPLERVVMLSWPPLKHRTAVAGETSNEFRTIDSVSYTNPQGWICRLAEVNISSEEGSSGAPLINGAGQFLTILHGGCGTRLSYFVSFRDVRDTLSLWGVV